tara:strand:+ start:266 stop:1513 length:1248 start_codon:yes stop_codon:yes gene_type:complete
MIDQNILDQIKSDQPELKADEIQAAYKKIIAEKEMAAATKALETEAKEAETKAKIEERATELSKDIVDKEIKKLRKEIITSRQGSAIVTKDNTWRPQFNKMLRHLKLSEYTEAEAISKSFQSKALNADAGNNTGRFLVPEEFHSQVFAVPELQSLMYAGANKITTGSDTINLISSGNVAFTYKAQGADLDSVDPTLAGPVLSVEKCGAYTKVANELLEDSHADVTDIMAQRYGDALTSRLKTDLGGNALANAAGSTPIFTTTGIGAVAQAGAALALSDIMNLVAQCGEGFSNPNNIFVMNTASYTKLAALSGNNNDAHFGIRMMGNLREATLGGFRVEINDAIPSDIDTGDGDADKSYILFGNPTEIVLAERGGLRIDVSNEAGFVSDSTLFRATYRYGFALPNASAWAKLTAVI